MVIVILKRSGKIIVLSRGRDLPSGGLIPCKLDFSIWRSTAEAAANFSQPPHDLPSCHTFLGEPVYSKILVGKKI